jgi:hypothetical protein
MNSTAATPPVAGELPSGDADMRPRFWRTYALTYALGAVWVAIEIVLIGTQPSYGFTPVYVAAFMLPPFLAIGGLLVLDPRGSSRTFAARLLALTTVAGLVSVLSTVILTPLLVLMFRERIGFSLAASGVVSWVSLLVVASPLVIELVRSVRQGRLSHAAVFVIGLLVVAVEVAMAIDASGQLATSLRRDQGAFLMVTASWLLPVFAAAVAYIRRIETD